VFTVRLRGGIDLSLRESGRLLVGDFTSYDGAISVSELTNWLSRNGRTDARTHAARLAPI